MSVSIRLNDTLRHWVTLRQEQLSVHISGYMTCNGRYRHAKSWAEELMANLRHLDWNDAVSRLRNSIPGWNGCWALVVLHDTGVLFAATDRIRSIPLFYRVAGNQVVVSPTAAECLTAQERHHIDDAAACELLLGGFTLGNRTVVSGLHKVGAGQYIEVERGSGTPHLRTMSYYHFLPSTDVVSDSASHETELHDRLDAAFAPLSQYSEDRTLLVSLSGGLDSRLVLALLQRQGARNLMAFTYGSPDCGDVRLAQTVATALEIPLITIPYTANTWRSGINAPAMHDYWRRAGQYASLPHLQDLPALNALREQLRDGPPPVVVTGHSGDFLAGSHIPFEVSNPHKHGSVHELARLACRISLKNWPIDRTQYAELLAERIAESLNEFKAVRNVTDADCLQAWELDNRISQFIVNNVRAYEFMGYDWTLPFFDYGLMDYFANTPTKECIGQRLYVNTLRHRVFTGKHECLSQIPITGGVAWASNQGLQRHRLIKRLLQSVGLLNAARRVRHRKTQPHPLAFDSWFSDGSEPGDVSVENVLQSWDVLPYLTKSVRDIVTSSSNKTLDQIHPNGLLAAVYLAAVSKQLQLR